MGYPLKYSRSTPVSSRLVFSVLVPLRVVLQIYPGIYIVAGKMFFASRGQRLANSRSG